MTEQWPVHDHAAEAQGELSGTQNWPHAKCDGALHRGQWPLPDKETRMQSPDHTTRHAAGVEVTMLGVADPGWNGISAMLM